MCRSEARLSVNAVFPRPLAWPRHYFWLVTQPQTVVMPPLRSIASAPVFGFRAVSPLDGYILVQSDRAWASCSAESLPQPLLISLSERIWVPLESEKKVLPIP